MNRTVIIMGSARSDGNTSSMVNYLGKKSKFQVIDLKKKYIGEFDYNFSNQNDDFHPLINYILNNYSTIVFATPVYWYSMSGRMKTFFDRISDLLLIDKATARKFKGKKMAVLSCSNEDDLIANFYMPFKETANYLDMQYIGDVHTWIEKDEIVDEVKKKLDEFWHLIL